MGSPNTEAHTIKKSLVQLVRKAATPAQAIELLDHLRDYLQGSGLIKRNDLPLGAQHFSIENQELMRRSLVQLGIAHQRALRISPRIHIKKHTRIISVFLSRGSKEWFVLEMIENHHNRTIEIVSVIDVSSEELLALCLDSIQPIALVSQLYSDCSSELEESALAKANQAREDFSLSVRIATWAEILPK